VHKLGKWPTSPSLGITLVRFALALKKLALFRCLRREPSPGLWEEEAIETGDGMFPSS
jgi:hypothetical protein